MEGYSASLYNEGMKKITRGFALLLSTALLHASFGAEAWAQIVPISGVTAPVGGSASASVTGNTSVGLQNGAPSFSVTLTQTGSALPLGPGFGSLGIGPSAIVSAASGSPISGASASRSAIATAKTVVTVSEASAIRIAAARKTPSGALVSAADETPSEKPAAETATAAPAKTTFAARVAAKTTASLDALKRLFTSKRAESLPDAEPVAAVIVPATLQSAANSELLPSNGANETGDDGAVVPPAPPTPPSGPNKNDDGNKGKGKGWFGLGAIVATLIGGMLVMQLGLEAQGAAMAKLTEDSFGDFSILAQVTIFAQIGSMIGQQLAQFFSGKFGLTKTFYAAQTLRAVSLGAMVLLLGTGMMPLPLMFVFYALNGIMTGVSATAEGTLRKFILAEQGVSQQKFRTWWQLLAEIIAVPAPMVFGALVGTVGASWITAIYPAAIVIGLLIFLMFKVMPISAAKRVEARLTATSSEPAKNEPAPAPKGNPWQRLKAALSQIASNMQGGMQFVLSSSVLKFSMIAAVSFDLMNLLIYRLIAPGYAKLVAGTEGMAAMAGNLVGMFSLGGLLLAVTFLVLERRAKKQNEGKTDEQKAAADRSSVLRWTAWGIPAIALLGVMALQLALPIPPLNFAGVEWLPTSALAAALIPFGFFQVAASIKLNSYFYDKLPADPVKVQKAIAFSGSAMTAMSIVLMLVLKPLFGDLGAFNPFPWIAGALIPVAAAVFFARKRLAKASTPGAEEKEGDAPSPALSGGFVGLLLGVIAAAVIAVSLPMIPAVGAWIGALSVLGKFLLQTGIAMALPTAGFFLDKHLRGRAAKKK